ncbi:TPA: hypothetical protein ACH3X1_009392 [Trebouxia sp. C0004]
MREAAFMASVTVRCSVFGVDLAIPLLELPCAAASPASVGTAQPGHAKQPAAIPAPSAEVAELQRRLIASGDENVATLMSINPEQLDPLDARGISRWLRAKGRNMDVAEEQIHIHAHWRQEFMPAGHIPENQVMNELASNKVYLQGCDAQGRTVFIVLAKQQEKGRPEETKRFICYTLDNAIAAADPIRNELGQFLCLFDLSGLRVKNLDVGALQAVFEVLQQHYPERLGELWFLNAPFIFWSLWRVVSPFIQANTKAKIKFLSGKDRERMLQESIPPDVLPQIYGGEAAMVPIEGAVHARLVREGLERARSCADNQTAEEVEDAEGRLTRAGRAVQRWASASADFARRHNPVNPIVHSRTVTRLKGWRPFNREGQEASYKDEATSTKGDGDNDSGLSQLEGGMGQLVHYLMPQVFIVAIFRKAQQALWWAWSHAQRMKGVQKAHEPPQHINNQPHSFRLLKSSSESDLDDLYEQSGQQSQTDMWQRPADERLYSRQVSNRKSLQAHRLSLSVQRYTPEVAARIWESIDGFAYMQDASPESSPRSYSIDEDDHSVGDDEGSSFTDQAKTVELQQLWQRQLQQDAVRYRQTPAG